MLAFFVGTHEHECNERQRMQAVGPLLGLVLCLSILFPLSMLVRGMVEVLPLFSASARPPAGLLACLTWTLSAGERDQSQRDHVRH